MKFKFWGSKATTAEVMNAYDTGMKVGDKGGYMRGFNIGYDAGYENGVKEGHREMDDLAASNKYLGEQITSANNRAEQAQAEARALRRARDEFREQRDEVRNERADLYGEIDRLHMMVDERDEELAVLEQNLATAAVEGEHMLGYEEGYSDGVQDAAQGVRYDIETPNNGALSAQYWTGYHRGFLVGKGEMPGVFSQVEVLSEDGAEVNV